MKIFGNTMWHLVAQSDAMTKGVLLLLFGMSIVSWTILMYKFLLLRIKKQQLKKAVQELQHLKNFDDVLTLSAQLYATYPGHLITTALKTFKIITLKSSKAQTISLDNQERDILQQRVDQLISDMIAREERLLPFLSASAAVGPLLGLFGTVWGLVDAFISIGRHQSADIAAIAPGIAEALITTVAGLLVAIPAVLMLYYLNGQVHFIETQLYAIADRLVWFMYSLTVGQQTEQPSQTANFVATSAAPEEHVWPE